MRYGTDYSKSALDLKNSLEVRGLLIAYGKAQAARDAATDTLDAIMEKLPEAAALTKATAAMGTAHKAVKAAVDAKGGLQDIEGGYYALKQRRESVSYSVAKVRELAPDYAKGVIVEQVDPRKLNGLHKGGLVSDAELKAMTIITPIAPAYIIGIAQKPEEVPSEQ
tara:strand:- start:1844 stop:2341 length:498 start_codon:yes stop_codon:yes gene_type:complete